jgi:hypothetical protein
LTEEVDAVTKGDLKAEEAAIKILPRERNSHEAKAFELRYEYGFREKQRTKKLRGGKVAKPKKEKRLKREEAGGKKEKRKRPRRDEVSEEEDDEPAEPEKVIAKVSMEELLAQLTAPRDGE